MDFRLSVVMQAGLANNLWRSVSKVCCTVLDVCSTVLVLSNTKRNKLIRL